MTNESLLRAGRYIADWIRSFYDQTAIWWGADPQEPGVHPARVATVERLCGQGRKRILDLGAGPGATAAALADAGHDVVAVELSERALYAQTLAQAPHKGSLVVHHADFYTVVLAGRFDVVCCWEVFGLGSDADQRRLLRRIAGEWLAPGGAVLMDVYSPFRPAHDAGTEEVLPPLPGVPGSVEMIERCHFDPVHCRWTDEWAPTAAPDDALAQSLRCYSPADLVLLLEGTGLTLTRIEVDGKEAPCLDGSIIRSGPLMQAWSYLAKLSAAACRPIPMISIVGRSKSGKTTLLEKLIVELKQRGYRVATIKHHAHPGFEIDQPGKDTWRHAQAGSDHVIIAAPDKIASIRCLQRELSLDEIAGSVSDVDIIITDGYRSAGKPSIEVMQVEAGSEPPSPSLQTFAIAANVPVAAAPPCFDWNDAAGLVDLIEQRFLRTTVKTP